MRLWAILFAINLNLAAQSPQEQADFRSAVAAQERGDFPAAETQYRELLRRHNDAIPVRVNLAAVMVSQGKFDAAIEQYRAVMELAPSDAGMKVNLALALSQTGQYSESAALLAPLHSEKPSDERIAALLGDAYSRLGRFPQAIAALLPAEKSHPNNLDIAWLLGTALIYSAHTEDGLHRIEKVAAYGHGNAPACLLAAETRLRLDEYDEALKQADAALRLDPNLAHLHTLRGMILEHTGDFAASATELQKGLQADAKDIDARVYLGAVLLYQRKLDDASEQLDKALQLDPSSPLARYEVALLRLAEGNLDAALEQLENVERQNPKWLQPHVELAALYYRMKRPKEGMRERQVVDSLSDIAKGEPGQLIAPVP